jgi:hypothetical protein
MDPMHRIHRKTALAAAVLALCLGDPGAVRAEEEAVGFGIDEFSSGSNYCGGLVVASDLNHSAEWVDHLDDIFAAEGWAQTTPWVDGGVDGRDWSDVLEETTYGFDDDDNSGADHADIALLVTHGGHTHGAGGNYSYFMMGDNATGADPDESCFPDTRDHFRLGNDGDNDAEVAIMVSCQSAHHDVWTDHGYDGVMNSDGGFSTWLGFHGNSYDGTTDRNRFEDYLNDSFSNGLADNWIDELYRNPIGGDNSQCPTAVIFCGTVDNCNDQHTWGGFEDRFEVGSTEIKTLSKYFYLGGCDPGAGPALPN